MILVLHNPNRLQHEFSLYDITRLVIDLPAAVDWIPPKVIGWPHPSHPKIVEEFELVDRDSWTYEYRRSRKRRVGDPSKVL